MGLLSVSQSLGHWLWTHKQNQMYGPTHCEAQVPQLIPTILWTSFFNLPIIFINFSKPREQTAKQWVKGRGIIHQLSCKWDTGPVNPWIYCRWWESSVCFMTFLEGLSFRCHQIILSITKANGKWLLTDSFLLDFLAISLWLPLLALLFSQRKPMTLEAFLLPF